MKDGCSYAYKYQDPRTGLFYITDDRREALRAGGDYEMVPVRVEGGRIVGLVRVRERTGSRPGTRPEPRPKLPSDEFADLLPDKPSDKILDTIGFVYGDSVEDDQLPADGGVTYPTQPKNGLGHAYRYRDLDVGEYVLSSSKEAALLAAIFGDEAVETVWVRYKDGEIDHVATREEWQSELEIRIGARVTAGVTREQVNEFADMIAANRGLEVQQWLARHCPNHGEIVEFTKHEMEKAKVLEADEMEDPAARDDPAAG